MIRKYLGAVAVLAVLAQTPFTAFPQANAPSTVRPENARPNLGPGVQPHAPGRAAAPAVTPPQAAPSAQNSPSRTLSPTVPGRPETAPAVPSPDTNNPAPDSYQPPHISIATPAPAPAPWPWQERIAWGANIVLVVLAYAGIMLAVSLLRKIERQTRFGEETAQAAAESSKAALELAQRMARAERPWILMTVRPSQNIENGFVVVANNRGRAPARILAMVDEVLSAIDEDHLPATPEFRNQPVAPADPMILLPDESTEIFSFSRDDVKRVCDTAERLARVEKWEEKIYLYGRVVYQDLTAGDDTAMHQSSWLCWYIHGRQKSGMVMAGPPAYNQHS